jgi:hypothetical protein
VVLKKNRRTIKTTYINDCDIYVIKRKFKIIKLDISKSNLPTMNLQL